MHRAVGAHVCFRAEMGYFRAVSKGLAGLKMVGLRKISYFRHNILIVWPYFRENFFLNFTHLDPKMGPAVISADFMAGPKKQCAPHFFKKVLKQNCADIGKVQHILKWIPKISLFLNNPIF